MQKIPIRIRERINESKRFKQYIHLNTEARTGNCRGRITVEHAWIYGGKQIPNTTNKISDELFYQLLVPCCIGHNVGVSGDAKDYNRFVALKQVLKAELWEELGLAYPKKNWNLVYNNLYNKFKK